MKNNIGYTEAKLYRGMYEQYKDDPQVDADQLNRKAQIFELFGQALDIDPAAALQIMDTGMLNEHMKAYFRIAMHRAGVDQDTQRAIMDSLRDTLDTYTAKEAQEELNRL